MNEEDDAKEWYRHECKCCFLCFEDEIEKVDLCHVCQDNLDVFMKNKRIRIERILSVLDKTLMCRYPQILRLIWDALK